MAKEFTVPPVVFPSGGGVNPSVGNINQRRVPTAPFQPSRPPSSSSALPFMSFDMGSATSSSVSLGGSISSSAATGSASFEDEEPLLDELGIHPDQIWYKTRSILNPLRVNPTAHKDSDLSGPIFLYLSLCLFQLLAGKIQFGVILGWIVVSSIFLYVVFNMLAGRNGNLDLHTCTSVVGYCMLPVVIFSAASLFIPQGTSVARYAVAGIFVVWATRACTNLMVALADGGEEHRGLISFRDEIVDHGGKSSETQIITKMKNEDEEGEEELFEINIEAVNSIPPPHYWEAFFTATSDALLANCLLPISDLSTAIPMVSSNACTTCSKVMD